jgi:serine/threonine protein kinase
LAHLPALSRYSALNPRWRCLSHSLALTLYNAPNKMALLSGANLGPYTIIAPLGAGGMGEVYRARDTRLDRTVAIKVLSARFTADPDSKRRFDREAKTISGLNHPHICVLYDIGHQQGTDFIVMEYLQGETLAQRLQKGPLPLDQTLKYGAQIAAALDKAHRNGIVHRDLKPGNIMLTATGAKLLDFGLAKESVSLASADAATVTGAPRRPEPLTQPGTVIGTFQYMSPEQVEGKEVDSRSDIFSFGAVLYEMVTGKRAFQGRTQLSVVSAILEKEPEPLSHANPVPAPALARAIQRCLAKDPDERWQSASDLAMELKRIGEGGSQSVVRGEERDSQGLRRHLPWLLCGMLALALLATGVAWRSSRPAESTMVFSAPMNLAAQDISIAPNGHTVAMVGYLESARKSVVWLYDVGSLEPRALSGTEGGNFPFWSPDGKSLGFFADGKLKKLDVAGGPVQTLCDARSGRGGTWNKDGVILFTPSGQMTGGLQRISASGGTAISIAAPQNSAGEASQRWPMFLPDGKHYLFLSSTITRTSDSDGIYVGQLDSTETHLVVKTTANAAYAAPGYLLFCRQETLFAQPFDLNRFQLTGEPIAVAAAPEYFPRILRRLFAVSDTGLLIMQKNGGIALSRLVWFDRKGVEVGSVGNPDAYSNLFLAPNGQSVAVDKTDPGNQNTEIWTYDLRGESPKRVTFDAALDAVPVWDPSGSRLIFTSTRQHIFDLYQKNADGAQEEKLMLHTEVDKYPNSWSRDGKNILYAQGPDLWFLTLPDLKPAPFLKALSTLKNAQFSPDGKWAAYASNETGRWEIYVTSFPEGRGKWQVSTDGGEQPRWRGDGKELFYLSSDAKIVSVPIKLGANFDPGAPATLFQANPRESIATSEQFAYDVDSSGQRFLINSPIRNAPIQPVSIILNWDANLEK